MFLDFNILKRLLYNDKLHQLNQTLLNTHKKDEKDREKFANKKHIGPAVLGEPLVPSSLVSSK